MAASHFFLGLSAGIAILTIPAAVMVPQLDIPERIGAWVAGPPPDSAPRSSTSDLVGLARPQRGYVPGQPTPTAEPAPTLAPPPTPRPAPGAAAAPTSPPIEAVPTLPPSGLQTGVVHSGGGGGVYVRRVAGIQSPSDAFLPDGSPILISASSQIQVSGQTWRSVRGLNGISGWVPSSMLSVDGSAQPPTPASQAGPSPSPSERALIVNTDGQGVALRRSARPDDRLPSGLREGTSVAILERSGSEWARVHADNGQEGWVPTQYLAPAAG